MVAGVCCSFNPLHIKCWNSNGKTNLHLLTLKLQSESPDVVLLQEAGLRYKPSGVPDMHFSGYTAHLIEAGTSTNCQYGMAMLYKNGLNVTVVDCDANLLGSHSLVQCLLVSGGGLKTYIFNVYVHHQRPGETLRFVFSGISNIVNGSEFS